MKYFADGIDRVESLAHDLFVLTTDLCFFFVDGFSYEWTFDGPFDGT
jgi:hypothetical protein